MGLEFLYFLSLFTVFVLGGYFLELIQTRGRGQADEYKAILSGP